MTPVGMTGVIAAIFAVASVGLFGLAIGFDPAAGAELVERMGDAQASDVSFVKWGALADALGYYLLPVGVVIAIRGRLPWPSRTLGDLATAGFVVYATIGSIGAGILAVAGSSLIGSTSDAGTLRVVLMMVEGLWQWIEPVPFVMWAAGTALALKTRTGRWWVLFSVMAVGGVLVWLGRVLNVDPVLIAGLGLWLIPFPFAFATVEAWSGGSVERRDASVDALRKATA